MNVIKNLKVQHKMLFPNVLYVILLGAIIFFFVNSNALIGVLSEKQKGSDKAADLTQKAAAGVQAYINKRISYSELEKSYGTLLPELKQRDLSASFEELWVKVNQIRQFREENTKIEKQVIELTNYSIEQSNTYIQQMVPKLADESTRASVSALETQVIGMANFNTSSNYKLQVFFNRLTGDLNEKKALFDLTAALLEIEEKAIRDLAGTPFEGLPKNARESTSKIIDLTTNYIKNVEAEQPLQQAIFNGTEARSKDIENTKNENNAELFSKIRDYFRNMLIIILVTSLIGIFTSVLAVRSVSRALKMIIGGMSEASQEVTSAADQLSTASQSLAEGASQQAAAIEETSSSLEEMASMTKQNAANANLANDLMKKAKQIVGQANGSMAHLTTSMDEISKASEDTSKIIKTIDEIAFQTNLLALNAAVEAARAGEAGAGFAVVADEVRNLAMRAAEAAKSTASLIEGTVRKTKEGSALVQKTNTEFSEVQITAAKMGELIGEISAASGEQAQGIEQISKAVSEMDKVVQQNSANAEESAAGSEEMSAQAEQMKHFVAELVAMVGGAGASREHVVSNKGAKEPKMIAAYEKKANGHLKAGNGKDLASLSKRRSGPEKVIPFDDADVSAF
ncbi:MAG: methyl-accepting chemotaxis protein [Syntrophobacteraceae bacterium]|jgi:methyl-accepting chemotaxis protein